MHIVLYGRDPYLMTGQGSRPNGKYGCFGNDSNRQSHPCAKPEAAMTWAVERVSLPSELVYDPFAGAFTTALACLRLGRRFVGCEIDQGYFDYGCARVAEASRQLDLFPCLDPTEAAGKDAQGRLFS